MWASNRMTMHVLIPWSEKGYAVQLTRDSGEMTLVQGPDGWLSRGLERWCHCCSITFIVVLHHTERSAMGTFQLSCTAWFLSPKGPGPEPRAEWVAWHFSNLRGGKLCWWKTVQLLLLVVDVDNWNLLVQRGVASVGAEGRSTLLRCCNGGRKCHSMCASSEGHIFAGLHTWRSVKGTGFYFIWNERNFDEKM